MYTSRPVGEMVRIGLSLKLSDLPSTDFRVDSWNHSANRRRVSSSRRDLVPDETEQPHDTGHHDNARSDLGNRVDDGRVPTDVPREGLRPNPPKGVMCEHEEVDA